jgi:hypothetical protein
VSQQSKFSNDQIEKRNALCSNGCGTGSIFDHDTAVAALPYVNQFTSAETFFLPVCRLL